MAKITLDVEVNSAKAESQLKSFTAAIAEISKSLNNIKANRNLTAQINAITKNYNALTKAADKVTKINNRNRIEEEKLAAAKSKSAAADLRKQAAEEQLTKAKINSTTAAEKQKTAEEQLKRAQEQAETAAKNNQIATERLTKAKKDNAEASEDQKKATNEHEQGIVSMLPQIAKWQVAMTMVMKPLDLLKKALGSVNETLVKTENRVIELKRALGESVSNQDVSGKLYDIAKRYGQTFESVSDVALNFARTGMSWADTIKATEAAVLALNVAELDATEASNGMIAILQQFGLEASDLTSVVDKLNITADNAAVTTNALLSALQRTGSSAANANLTLDQTVGIVTALSQATGRSGENLGTAVNSLIQLSTKASSLDTFAKINDDLAATVEGYRHGTNTVLDIWHELSEVVKPSNMQNESILSGMLEGEDWQNLNQELQDTLGENFATVNEIYDTASTYRKNYFIALLNNMDQVEESIATMGGAAGYSMRENEEYLDTYTAKVNSLKAAWEELANDEQGLLAMKKWLVEAGTGILKMIEWTGGLRTVLIAAGSAAVFLYGPKAIQGIKNFAAALKTAAAAGQRLNAALGVAGLVATAASAIFGVIQQAREEEREANLAAIEAAESNREKAESLQELYDQYKQLQGVTNRTEEQNNTYYQTESQLVELLGEKANVLQTLNKKSGEYTEAINKMTEAELENYRTQARLGARAAREELENANIGDFSFWSLSESEIFSNEDGETPEFRRYVADILEKAGVNVSRTSGALTYSGREKYELSDLRNRKTVEAQLTNYKVFQETQKAIQSEIDRLLKESGGVETPDTQKLKNLKAYIKSASEIKDAESTVKDFFTGEAAEYIRNYEVANGKITTQEQLDDATKFIIEQFNNSGIDEYFNDNIKIAINSLVRLNEAKKKKYDLDKNWENSLANVADYYGDIVDSLDAILDKEKKAIDLERQKQALEDAKNQRNVRVFNARTGQWEWQSNAKEVAEAEDALKQTTADMIKEQLQSGNTTNEQMLSILEDIDKYIPDFVDDVKALIKEKTGVDLDKPVLTENPAETPETEQGETQETEQSGSKGLIQDFIQSAVQKAVISAMQGDSQEPEQGDSQEPETGYVQNASVGAAQGASQGVKLSDELIQKLTSDPIRVTPAEEILRKQYATSITPLSTVLRYPGMVPQWMADKTINNTTNNTYTLNGIPFNAEDVWDKKLGDIIQEMDLLAHGNEY